MALLTDELRQDYKKYVEKHENMKNIAGIVSEIQKELVNFKGTPEEFEKLHLYSQLGLLYHKNNQNQITTVSVIGKEILTENSFFRDLISLVSTPEFKKFRENHMKPHLEVSIIYFELYELLEKYYKQKMDEELPVELAVILLKNIMNKREYRRPFVNVITKYIKEDTNRKKLENDLHNVLFQKIKLLDRM